MESTFSEESKKKLGTIVSKTMAEVHAPGVSMALLKEGKVVYAKGFGARDVERNLPATPRTLYGIGSCTKSFTALAVMKLVGEERLNIGDPISEHLPFEPGNEDEPITIQSLLSMSSGMPADGMAGILIKRMTGVGDSWIPLSDIDDFLVFVNNSKGELADKPGKRYFYYNTGFTLLGEVVERVSGVPYEDYIAENILRPLGMERSTFKREAFEADPDRMTAYRKEKDGSLTATVHPFHKLIYAPGGLLSPVTELTNYLKMNLGGGVYEGETIIDQSLLEKMHTGYTATGEGIFGTAKYCYGWAVLEDFLGHRMIRHSGSTGVSSAMLGFIPDLDIGVAFASNIGSFGPTIPHAAMALLMDRDPEKDIPYIAEELDLASLTGEYEAYEGTNMVNVVKKGALLYVEQDTKWSEMSVPLIPERREAGNRRFTILTGAGGKTLVEFEEASDGGMDLYMERWRLHRKRK